MMSHRDQLIKCSEAIKQSLMANDIGALKELYMEDFRGFSIRGEEESLEMILEAYQPGTVMLKSFQVKDQKAEVFGEVGIIMGSGYISGSYGQHQFEHHICFTDLYLYVDGRWRCYRSQATEVTKQ